MTKGYYANKECNVYFQGKIYTVQKLQEEIGDIIRAKENEQIVTKYRQILIRIKDALEPIQSKDLLDEKMDGDEVKRMLATLQYHRLIAKIKISKALCYLLTEQGITALSSEKKGE